MGKEKNSIHCQFPECLRAEHRAWDLQPSLNLKRTETHQSCAWYLDLPVMYPIRVRKEVLDSWFWKQRNPSILHVLDELEGPEVTGQDLKPTAGWRIAQKCPSEIHVELMANGIIPDPYLGFNEHAVQCQWEILLSSSRTLDLFITRGWKHGMVIQMHFHIRAHFR